MGKRARVFLNERSGAGGCSPDEIAALFAERGWSCEFTQMNSGAEVKRLAQTDDAEVVFVAAGGDGTVNAVAGAVAGTSRCMGILPVGTLNHFARDMRLPEGLKEAVAVIAGGESRAVDAGEVNGQVFVNNSSIGAYPRMVLDRERMKRSGQSKWAALVVASAKAFVRFRCLRVELEANGELTRCMTPFVFVGNNEYCLDGKRLGGRERLDGGELWMYLAPGARRVTILKMVFAALLGKIEDVPEYTAYKAGRLTVHVRRRGALRVSLDGEVKRMHGPLRYAIRPRSLQVLCGDFAGGPTQNDETVMNGAQSSHRDEVAR